ncbi:Myb-related protein B [Holothuria leucospilota]|uniref:Myb-related protein B n=1 Tax=Holothuria leucospilota TaxID=206669 RepID=A0A9Q1CS46_HOLLE|nr:Myb-related protein B [Holothuria leucospilota]
MQMMEAGQGITQTLNPIGYGHQPSCSQDSGFGGSQEIEGSTSSDSESTVFAGYSDLRSASEYMPFENEEKADIFGLGDKENLPVVPHVKLPRRVSTGDLHNSGYRFDSSAMHDLSKESSGSLISITSPQTSKFSKFSTPPTILKKSQRKRRRKQNSQSADSSMDSSLNSTLDTPAKTILQQLETPSKNTPIKSLPFSPSQFLNVTSASGPDSPIVMITSTPISKLADVISAATPSPLITQLKKEGSFRTPKAMVIDNTPRTPTPFKDALRAIERQSGALKQLPQTPNKLNDISEIIGREGTKIKVEPVDVEECNDLVKQECDDLIIKGAYPTSEGGDTTMRRVRKALEVHLKEEVEDEFTSLPTNLSTLTEDSLPMSPIVPLPSASRHPVRSLNQAFLSSASTSLLSPNTSQRRKPRYPPQVPVPQRRLSEPSADWERVACGKTKDQLIMSEMAKKYLKQKFKPRTLIL